jgi:hypothetical protein
MTALCRECAQARCFPNQGRTLPRQRHAAKFGGVWLTRSARCPADAAVKFTALAAAELPLEVAPRRQAGSRAAQGDDASIRPGRCRRPAPQARDPRSSATPHPRGFHFLRPRSPLHSVLIASQLGLARLDTPLPSGRVEEAKNGAISGASVTCRPLQKGRIAGPTGAAKGPRRGTLRGVRSDSRKRASGQWWQERRGGAPPASPSECKAAQQVVNTCVGAAYSWGRSGGGSISRSGKKVMHGTAFAAASVGKRPTTAHSR